jgi:hypothetical protein
MAGAMRLTSAVPSPTPRLKQTVALRRVDEAAKEPGALVAPFETYIPRIRRVSRPALTTSVNYSVYQAGGDNHEKMELYYDLSE